MILFVAAMSACTDDDSAIQPDLAADYVSAEAYLEDIGFTGSVLIQNGEQCLGLKATLAARRVALLLIVS
ncbi:hypothetical protein [Lewinella cohaerens]|uniref:hypothetical protein n=1 Tax=Lewinella cohaerens TaxID=70995 RepID=UPI00035EFABA|nr:hypothetical protein [Lewinella cohaerens]